MVAQLHRNQDAHHMGKGEPEAEMLRLFADLGQRDTIELLEKDAAPRLDRRVFEERRHRLDGLAVELRRIVAGFDDEAERQRKVGLTMTLPDLFQRLFREAFSR
ncbi:hypothetical protein EN742_00625 [Mesorhizobium sp. M4A.F.Ca.ET.020.02.1.1]|uniref:hypothetical protein n=1 Tax=Mesorhizobium sp. M4A.F.Ca.ET.020.02.1.1 TaxID=2496652 RepID=UPI000FD6017A|nr:hypothetical protein [Mesorhizobium sp. M4A.F.Ca.ET.020.02.1.1]RVD44883.1 hypothetical protein EN742_00625 [Mesorhizobium sp. M4A.F.Ca.ET.020.02.1.1]